MKRQYAQITADSGSCPSCHNRDQSKFMDDDCSGDRVCMQCGHVLGRLLSNEAEWRSFSNDSNDPSKCGRGDPSRVGHAYSIYDNTSSVDAFGTQIKRCSSRSKSRRLNPFDNATSGTSLSRVHWQTMSSGERPLDRDLQRRIRLLHTMLQCENAFVLEYANRLQRVLEQAMRAPDASGVCRRLTLRSNGVAAILLFLSYRLAKMPRTLAEMSDIACTSKDELRRAYHSVKRACPAIFKKNDTDGDRSESTGTIDNNRVVAATNAPEACANSIVEDVVSRLCSLFHDRLSFTEREHIVRQSTPLKEHCEGRNPSSIAAAIVTHLLNLGAADRRKVASCAGVNDATVRAVRRTLNEQLNVQ